MNPYVCGSYIPANGVNEQTLGRIDFQKITHVFLAFSLLEDKNGLFVPVFSETLINAIALVKARIASAEADTRVLVSIGGAGADGFCEAAKTEENREAFAAECRRLICENELDGIDMDWEFPGLSHLGITSCDSCTEDFILLLSEIRKAIGSRLLTAAVGSDHFQMLDNQRLNRLLDLVNVMTYDMNNTAHSAFSLTDSNMSGWHSHGIDREKLVLGVPFYARCVNPDYEWMGYDRLMELVKNAGATLLSTEDQDYVQIGENRLSVDTPRSIKKKSAYIKQNGFAGIFNWQELTDYSGELRNAMYELMCQ